MLSEAPNPCSCYLTLSFSYRFHTIYGDNIKNSMSENVDKVDRSRVKAMKFIH